MVKAPRKQYLWEKGKGTGRWHVRIKSKAIPIRNELGAWCAPETPDFDRVYWEIMTGRRAEAKRSFNALIDRRRQSDRWAALAPRTRADYEKVHCYIAEKIGKRDVSRLTTADIYEAMEANRHRVRFANLLPIELSQMFKLAIKIGWRSDNPALGVEPLAMPKAKKRPHVPWTDTAVAKARAEMIPAARLIFELGVGTGQRPSDLLAFTWGDYDGDRLKLRQGKTDKPLELPCTEHLKSALDTARAELGFLPLPTRHILCKPDGSAMSYFTMARIMRAERERLGLLAFDLHAMRYRAVKELAWAGCTDDEIAAYSGHASMAMIRKYAGEARQIMRARQAREKRR